MHRHLCYIFLFLLLLSSKAEADSLTLPFNLKHLSAREQANVLNDMAFRLAWQNPERVAKYAKQALKKSRSIGHLEGIGRSYHNLGNAALFLGSFYESLDYYQQAQLFYDSAGMKRLSFGLKGDIAEVYAEINDFERSEELLLEIIPQQEKAKDTLDWAISLRRFALLLSNQNKYIESIEYLEESLELMELKNDTIGVGLAHSELGNVYLQLKDYKSAGEHLMQAAFILDNLNVEIGFLRAVNRIGRLLIDTDRFDLAIDHLNESMQRARSINARTRILEAYQLLAEVNRKRKDFEKALEYQDLLTNLKDTIINMQKAEQIAAMQVKYEAKARELEVEELKNNKNIQSLKIWFLLIMIVVSGTLLSFWLMNQKKASKQLKAQFDEIERKNQLIKLKHEEIEEANKELTKAQKTIATQNTKLIGVNADLEEMVKQRTQALSRAVNRLTIANEELDSLIFHSSHSLKSPLTSLKGLSMLGSLETQDSTSKAYFNRIDKEADVMLRLQKNLMLIHEVKHNVIKSQKVRLSELIKSLKKQYQAYINLYQAEILVDVPENIVLETQPEWLMAILKNLVENAVFFCRLGERPNISVQAINDGKQCQIHVRDKGIGIEQENSSNIFEMFFRGSSSSGGSGLGLYVCQLAVKRLGGEIKLMSSSQERGSHFCVYVPLSQERF